MTQLIAYQSRRGIFLATDRRTSRLTAPIRLHDPDANKTIVALLRDAVVGVAYTGDAYIDGTPTDEWIAQTLFEMLHPSQEFPRDNFIAGCEVDKIPPFRKAIKQLTRRLEATGTDITILVAGLGGAADGSYFQILWRWSSSAPRKPFGDLRPKRLYRSRLLAAGQLDGRAAALILSRIVAETPATTARQVADCLTRCIREIGAQNAGVGQDVAVTWFEPQLVTALFCPNPDWIPPPLTSNFSLAGSANSTPWIIAPGGVSCPTLAQTKTQAHLCGLTFEFDTTAQLPAAGRVDVLAQPRMNIRGRLKSSTLYTNYSYPAPKRGP